MKNLIYFAEEISKGNKLSENLTKYATGISTMYSSLAYIKISMKVTLLRQQDEW